MFQFNWDLGGKFNGSHISNPDIFFVVVSEDDMKVGASFYLMRLSELDRDRIEGEPFLLPLLRQIMS